MITMPDPHRQVERSAAIFRKYGASRRQSYEAVADIAGDLLYELADNDDLDLRWLARVVHIANQRAFSSPADDSPHAPPPSGASAPNAGSPRQT